MLRCITILIVPLLFISCAAPVTKHHERYYQTQMCHDFAGEMEYVLEDRTRVDCLTDEYAIEVDFAKKWAESIGQSLFYAQMTGKKPAIGLIVDRKKEQRYVKRLNLIAKKYNITVFILPKYEQ